ncbi:MAG: nuclease-related domain-containing protein [Propionicimonas sp.]|nr:nuclease-related domain-containing protein [Propionicimonas sp.]
MPPSDPPAAGSASSTTAQAVAHVPQRGIQGRLTDVGLVVTDWSKWGRHRLYVDTRDGRPVGWLDQDTGQRSLEDPAFAPAFEAALQQASAAGDAPDYSPRRTFVAPAVDLAGRRPGEQLEARIAATLDAGGELQPARPGFEGRHAYSSWELGVLGEQAVARQLDRLAGLDPRWRFLNSIPVGTHRADIDHLVVGPGGVFTVNAKHHHGGEVWVGGDACLVNQAWRHYVPNARAEAARAASMLTAAAGTEVVVRGLVVVVGVARLTVRQQPADVRVLDQSELVDFLTRQPACLDESASTLVLDSARIDCTWRS